MRHRVRLPIDLAVPATFDSNPLRNEFGGGTPVVFLERAVDIEMGIFFQNVLQSITDLQVITFELKTVTDAAVDVDSTALVSVSLSAGSLNTALTRDQWDNGTAQHAKFELTSAQMLLSMTGHTNNRKRFAGVFCATGSDGEPIGLGTFPIDVVEDGCGSGGTPPEPDNPNYLTAAETIAMMNGFLKKLADPGDSITLPSGNSRWETIIYTDNDDGEIKMIKNGPLN